MSTVSLDKANNIAHAMITLFQSLQLDSYLRNKNAANWWEGCLMCPSPTTVEEVQEIISLLGLAITLITHFVDIFGLNNDCTTQHNFPNSIR